MSNEPNWVTSDHVLRLHDRVIETIGGAAGIRDQDLLESAVARPQNLHAYEGETDPFKLAASYAEGIAQNHPFTDGNKRSAFLTADLFLSVNGYSLDASNSELHTQQMVALAQGDIDCAVFAQHLQDHSVRIERGQDRVGEVDHSAGDRSLEPTRTQRWKNQMLKSDRDDGRER